MKLNAIIISFIILSFTYSKNINTGINDKIGQVENGLLPNVLIKGEKSFNLEDRMKHYNVPGISIAVIKDYEIEWCKQYGVMDSESNKPITENTLFNVGSLSKGIASLGVLNLVNDGILELEADVNTYLTSWKVPQNEFTAVNSVTPLMLMNHSGGAMFLPGIGYTRDNFPTNLQILNGEKPAQSKPVIIDIVPGTKYQYSNAGYSIIQQLITDVTKQPFSEYNDETIFQPLEMQNTTFQQPLSSELIKIACAGHMSNGLPFVDKQYYIQPSAAGGLWTTAGDYAKYVIELQKSNINKSNRIISTELTNEMLSPHISKQYGLGVFIREMYDQINYFGHMGDGRGFFAGYVSHLTDGYGAVVFTNSQNGVNLIREITNGIAKVYNWDLYLPVEYSTISLDDNMVELYIGRYLLGSDDYFEIKNDIGQLFMNKFNNSKLYHIGNGEFVTKFRKGTLKINLGTDYNNQTAVFHFADNLGRFLYEPINCYKMQDGEKIPLEYLSEGEIEKATSLYRQIRITNENDFYISENRFNSLGYKFLSQKKYNEAIAIFKLNVEFYPNSSNVYDSLAEAYMNSGNYELAKSNYQKSLELNPQNTNAVNMLQKINNSK